MRTKIIYIIVLMALNFGCNDALVEEPFTFLAPENLQLAEGAEAAVKAAYAPLQSWNLYKEAIISQLEFKSDYMASRGSRIPSTVYNLDITNTGRVDGIWFELYNAINRANVVITSFPKLTLNKDLLEQWIAEAKVLRAFEYFHLVRCYGGVPLRLEPLSDLSNVALARSGENEVYAQIIKDLTEAIATGKLPEDYPSAGKGRITIHAARTMLADVYLTTEKWSDAAATALLVINSGKFQLEPDMYKMFKPEDGSTHSGEIWSVKWARKTGLGSYFQAFMHSALTKYSSVGYFTYIGILKSPVIANWDDNDKRKQLNLYNTDKSTLEGQSLTTSVPMLFKKFIDTNPGGDEGHGNDYPLYRYADALLIFAEAKSMADNGPGADAYEAVNNIRRRAYGVNINTPAPGIDLTGLDKDSFRDAVMNERAHEFIMEAKRWYDLKRMDFVKATEKITASGKAEFWSADDLHWPIPKQEIDNNDLINLTDQNPGY